MRRSKFKISASLVKGLALVAMAGCLLTPTDAQAESPEETFKTKCAPCHTVGGGKLIGPDLKGITDRRDEAWLLEFIPSAKRMADSGDPIAKELLAQYPGVVMTDQPLSQDEIKALLEFIKGGGGGPVAPLVPATPEDIARGEKLFQGTERLSGGGAPCISCHDVNHDDIIGGGVLAKELTTVFGRLGGTGVRAVIGSPPFPVMQAAYKDKALTPDEVTALVGFLQSVNADQADHMPGDTGLKLAASGIGGTAVLLFLYSMIWGRRKRGSVNQEIYDRQVKSQ